MRTSTLPQAQPLRAFLYQRASVDPLKKATSTADQHAENVQTCQTNDWIIAGSFTDDGRSASRHAKTGRPEYERMVAGIRGGEVDVIVAWEPSRANRDVVVDRQLCNLCATMSVLICYNGRLYDPNDPTDRFVLGLGALQAEYEADAIKARNMRTTRRNAATGRPHGRIPYGYRREYDPKTGILVNQFIDEDQAQVVRDIARHVAANKSIYWIAQDLNDRGVAPPAAKQWTPRIVKKLLLKPTNIGKRQFQEKVIGDATWDPILDEKTYRACERILTDPRRRTAKDNAVKWLLSGIATCWCGGVLRTTMAGSVRKYICTTGSCCLIRVDVFDAIVQKALLEYVERPEFAESLMARGEQDPAEAARIEIGELELELEMARAEFAARRLSLPAMSALEASVQPLIDAARGRARDVDVPPILQRVTGPGARRVWEELDLMQRREVIRKLMKVQLNRAGIGVRVVSPDRYTITFLR